jgi:hypothetical protein
MSALVSNQKTFAGCYAFGKAAEGTALAKLQNSPVWAGLEINRSVGDKDTYDYPIDGWTWFNSEEEAVKNIK